MSLVMPDGQCCSEIFSCRIPNVSYKVNGMKFILMTGRNRLILNFIINLFFRFYNILTHTPILYLIKKISLLLLLFSTAGICRYAIICSSLHDC
uniref:Uncharacterized protein n=1 Tax=Octopus bimaculoides TaxID=37653 RepID=A0A0L8G1M8_OCTBM